MFLLSPGRQSAPINRPSIFGVELLEDRCVPAVLTVNSLADGGGDPGELTLREAIEAVNAGDTTPLDGDGDQNQVSGVFGFNDRIVFDASLDGTLLLESDMETISASVEIDGSTAGGDIIIDGAGKTFSPMVIDFDNGDMTVTLNALTLQNGLNTNGGGLYTYDGDNGDNLILTNSTISNSESTNFGGGLFIEGANAYIANSQISENASDNNGGGVYIGNAELVIFENVVISDNHAPNDEYGGGVYVDEGGDIVFRNSVISGNTAEYGGGIYNISDSLSIINSTISGNSTTKAGGGVYTSSTDYVYVANSTFYNNHADDYGGAFTQDGSVVYIMNSTFSGNSAGTDGGALYVEGGDLVIINSTITNNQAQDDGGGIFLYDSSNTLEIYNSIVSGNTAGGDGNDLYDEIGNEATGSNNIFTTAGISGTNNFANDPTNLYIDDIASVIDTVLANNGGPTLTHALLTNSIAIDAGDDALAVDENDDPLLTDQRGIERFLGAPVDIGALEYSAGEIITSPSDGQTVTGPSEVTLENVFDLNDSNAINTIEQSLSLTNGTISAFVDNGDGTVTFTVTPSANGEVTLTAFDDQTTLSAQDINEKQVGAFEVTVTPDDGTLAEDDIDVQFTDPITNAAISAPNVVRNLTDNGDGSFTFTVSPQAIGTYQVFVDGESVMTVDFEPLTLGDSNSAFITNLYIRLFNRNPAESEVEYWLTRMEDGLFKREVIANFFASSEFGDGLSDADLIDKAYLELFGRSAETDFWADALSNATTTEEKADVFVELLKSDEASDLFSQEVYNEILNRVGEAAGANYWAEVISNGEIEDAEVGMAQSAESTNR